MTVVLRVDPALVEMMSRRGSLEASYPAPDPPMGADQLEERDWAQEWEHRPASRLVPEYSTAEARESEGEFAFGGYRMAQSRHYGCSADEYPSPFEDNRWTGDRQ